MSRDYEISECIYRRIEITNSTCTCPRRRTPRRLGEYQGFASIYI